MNSHEIPENDGTDVVSDDVADAVGVDRLSKLTPVEIRIIGSMIEKELTTPEYYPLTLNALVNACNQKSNRDPVMALAGAEAEQALDTLRYKHQLTTRVHVSGSRTHKYRHTLTSRFKLNPEQTALLCELFLRGPETVGELRGRASRLIAFDSLDAVEKTLGQLRDDFEYPLVTLLPREPGRRESRYMHLFGGPPADRSEIDAAAGRMLSPGPQPTLMSRMDTLETEVRALRAELAELKSFARIAP